MTRAMLVRGGSEYTEKADGKFTDLRTMRKAKAKHTKKRKRKQKYYNIDRVKYIGKHVSMYVLKPHFNFIPPFGFQLSEIMRRDVENLLQIKSPFRSI